MSRKDEAIHIHYRRSELKLDGESFWAHPLYLYLGLEK
jgi:hypothetical protein